MELVEDVLGEFDFEEGGDLELTNGFGSSLILPSKQSQQ